MKTFFIKLFKIKTNSLNSSELLYWFGITIQYNITNQYQIRQESELKKIENVT